MKYITLRTCLTLKLLFLSAFASAEVIPFSDERWTLIGDDTRIVTFDGREALLTPLGGALLKDTNFTNGIIEVDIFFPDATRGFSGVSWREQENGTYEHFYIRPHMSGNVDATQYTPVFTNDTGWQLYFGPGHAVALDIKHGKWSHLKIVVAGDQAEVYLDSEEPVLFIDDLKANLESGMVGVGTTFAPAYYSNFSVTHIGNPILKGKAAEKDELPDGLIKSFRVTDVIADDLTNPSTYQGDWSNLAVETSGALNIGRYRERSENHNTVLVKLVLNSEINQTKKFTYGYSDDVVIYMHDRPIAGGTNIYQSRDYRYLGTIGLFDDVYLPLEQGINEIYFAVKESFGGWGFMGRFENMDGITLE